MTDQPALPGKFTDLRARMLSALVMVPVGAAAIWFGGAVFMYLVVLLTGAMIWELATITAPDRRGISALVLAAAGAAALAAALVLPGRLVPALLVAPALLLALPPRRDPALSAGWAAAAMVSGFALVILRAEQGLSALLWLILVVVLSDLAGYFAGRILGGPKFWPAISPKKTWSGTVAGWIGAALVGLGFVLAGKAGVGLLLLSPLVAFAGQMGDIAESWIKRRAGVKDSSQLIPGHGGVMDRFDAMTGAAVAVMLLGLFVPLPLPGAGAP